jgi:oxygen-independent coproporphyrinogen-3 oxidase
MTLLSKYNVAAPRYTSYPTVPYWEQAPSQDEWREKVAASFRRSNASTGISLYIHLPFCESLCTYCACNTRITINHAVEAPYIDALLKEWDMYAKVFGSKPLLREVHLGGGTPTFFSPASLERLMKGILDKAEIFPKAAFSFEGHPNNTTRAHLQTLHALGFTRVSYGVQDLDPTVQDAINRVQPFENVERAVREAREAGYESVNFDLVYGLPFQKQEGLVETVQSVIRLKPDRIAFYSYAHVPWLKPGQRKFTEKDLPVDKEKRALYETGLELFKAAGYRDIGMDHFSLEDDELFKAQQQKTLHRNFMGYTADSTELMIGLGASSISDTFDCFMQNSKTVEAYQDQVNQGIFPIMKGHVLNEEDKIIRRHILNIMCRYETNWEPGNCSVFITEALERCKILEDDGLIEVHPGRLIVTETGKAFLRNICMCFDARYWRKVPQAVAFSTVA